MEEKTLTRIGIVASIVGAVGGLVYLLRKPPAAGPAGPPGAQGVPGTPGGPGLAAAASTPAGAGVPGAAASTPPTPSGQSLNQYFVSQFFPSNAASTGITSNVPPGRDLSKRFTPAGASPANGAAKSGCGCGGGGGIGGACSGPCGGGRCPNQPSALNFPDGAGSCAHVTVGRLQAGMDKCSPGNLDAAMVNMMGNTQSWTDNPDFPTFQASVEHSMSKIPGIVAMEKGSMIPNNVPASRFGAS